MSAKIIEELSDVFLEDDHDDDDTYRHQLVEDGSQQAHLQDLRHEEPYHDEDHDAHEDVQRT